MGTITGVDGPQQVTLNSLPLYTFTADQKPGTPRVRIRRKMVGCRRQR